MSKRRFLFLALISCLVLLATLFVLPVSYGIADGNVETVYVYLFGAPFDFVAISASTDSIKGFYDAIVNGNDISIIVINLLMNYIIIFLSVNGIFLFIKKFSRKEV